jgi:hypothetical protein
LAYRDPPLILRSFHTEKGLVLASNRLLFKPADFSNPMLGMHDPIPFANF